MNSMYSWLSYISKKKKAHPYWVFFFFYSFFEIMRKEPIDCIKESEIFWLCVIISYSMRIEEKMTKVLFDEREDEFNFFSHLWISTTIMNKKLE
jgi:hypothetical protein